MATSNVGESITSPGEMAHVFAQAVADDDDVDAELAKLHENDDEDDEVNETDANLI